MLAHKSIKESEWKIYFINNKNQILHSNTQRVIYNLLNKFRINRKDYYRNENSDFRREMFTEKSNV